MPTIVASVVSTSPVRKYEKWLAVCNGGNVMVSRDTGGGNGQDLYEGIASAAAPPSPMTSSTRLSAESSTFLSTDCLIRLLRIEP